MYCCYGQDCHDFLKEKDTLVEHKQICFMLSQKISIALPQRGFRFKPPHPPPIALDISVFAHVLSFKNLVFEIPSPLEFPRTLLVMGMDISWNHTLQRN